MKKKIFIKTKHYGVLEYNRIHWNNLVELVFMRWIDEKQQRYEKIVFVAKLNLD